MYSSKGDTGIVKRGTSALLSEFENKGLLGLGSVKEFWKFLFFSRNYKLSNIQK